MAINFAQYVNSGRAAEVASAAVAQAVAEAKGLELDKAERQVQGQVQEESAAEEHADQLNAWRIDVERELVRIGKSKELLNDHYRWFETQFKRGAAPTTTASECAFPD